LYTGGALLDRFVGNKGESDGHFPEDWLASTVRALNREHSQGPNEGLARTLTPDGRPGPLLSELLESDAEAILGPRHVAKHGSNPAVLCKYLDSRVRLPIQCHPDVPTARKFWNSEFGKTESWHILDLRRVDGQQPYLLMGFKPGVTQGDFADAVSRADVSAMVDMLHKVSIRPGETYLVPARLPHAIGPGVFMLEVQEPSDWCIQPERYCADVELTDEEMWCGLTQQQAMEVFDYTGMTKEQLLARLRLEGKVLDSQAGGGTVCEVIGPEHTRAFGIRQAWVDGRLRVEPPCEFAIVVVAAGEGTIRFPGGSRKVKKGDYFLQPFGVKWIEYQAKEQLRLVFCLPPR